MIFEEGKNYHIIRHLIIRINYLCTYCSVYIALDILLDIYYCHCGSVFILRLYPVDDMAKITNLIL